MPMRQNASLQASWTKHGPESFAYEILETSGVSDIALVGGEVRFLGEAKPALQIDRPYLIDGAGRRHEDRARWTLAETGGLRRLTLVVDAKGLVYIADRQNRRVQIFDDRGTYVKEWKFAGLPCGLFIGPGGQFYLVSGFAGQILKLDADGKAIAATGQPGKGLGEFGEAHYMTMGSRDEIYVADTVNPALHKFVKR